MSGDPQVPHRAAILSSRLEGDRFRKRTGGANSLSRRRLLAGSAGLGGSLLIAGTGIRTASGQNSTLAAEHGAHGTQPSGDGLLRPTAWESEDLVEPEVRRSVNGELRTELRVGYAYHDIGGYRLSLRTYEGRVPGPTLRVQPGNVLRITLINDLPANREELPVNPDLPHRFNTTNFHFHGGHVSPSGISDNVLRSMEPGQSHEIEIHIPDDHTRGTAWYHPHHHGSADVQLSSGMVGAIVVDGDFADVPEIADAQERVLILSEVLFDYLGTIEDYDTLWPEAVPRFLAVNGQREPIIQMRPGEVQRWRIIDAAHENNFRLALDGHVLNAVAYDGIQASQIDQYESLVIAPGQRADLLVQAGSPGTYELKAIANDQGYPSPTGPLAHVVVAGEPLRMALPGSLPAPPLATIRDEELTGSGRLTFTALEPEYPPAANYQEFAFLIDGRRFDPNRVDQHIQLGAVEEWTVINDTSDDHVFHIHTNPFQVTKLNGQPLSTPVWRDSVVVPREGSLTFRSRFLDFTGRTVLHCHMMNHEELGMMQLIEISDVD